MQARRVILRQPLGGLPSPADFAVEPCEVAQPGQGQFLVRNLYASVDPGTRARMSPGVSYTVPLKAGEMVSSFALGQVVESRHPDWAAGDWLVHASGWSEYHLSGGKGYLQKLDPACAREAGGVPLSCWIGVLGIPGMTAWFGINRVGALKAGERVLVSSAAGAVGASAGQIARLHGAAHVTGIAGGERKCGWLRDQAGFDAVIDYKAVRAAASDENDYRERLRAALAQAQPEGFDVFFDNVGNRLIDTVIPQMRTHGRIVISGTVADYNTPADQMPGLFNTRHFIAQRLRMEGILVFDDRPGFAQAQARMADWIAQGRLAWREERFEGIERMPEAFIGLFTGENFGRRIVQLAPRQEFRF